MYTRTNWKKDRIEGDKILKVVEKQINAFYPKSKVRFVKDRAWTYSIAPQWDMRHRNDDEPYTTRLSVSYSNNRFDLTISDSGSCCHSSRTMCDLSAADLMKTICNTDW